MARQSEELESAATVGDMVFPVFSLVFFSCFALEPVLGGSGALRGGVWLGLREFSFAIWCFRMSLGCLRSSECGCPHRAGVFLI